MSIRTACQVAFASASFAVAILACGDEPYDGETVEEPSVPKGSSLPSRASSDAGGSSLQPSPPSSSPSSSSSSSSSGSGGADDKPAPTTPTPVPTTTPIPPPPPPTPPAPPPNECGSTGPAVFAFVDGSEAWRYSTSSDTPSGFFAGGLAFRTAPATTSQPSTTLYLLKNGNSGDFLVSTLSNEGASIGYAPIATLGKVFLEQVPGSVPLVRYLKEVSTLRHRVSIDGNSDPNWTQEPPRGFVCPR